MKVPKDSRIDSIGLSETGNATYYCYNTKRIAANGSVYDPTGLTCAYYKHTNAKRKYLNRQVRVCTDTCIVLTVTDNGAFRDGSAEKLNRVIDLTPYAFKLLGGKKEQGVLKNVRVTVL